MRYRACVAWIGLLGLTSCPELGTLLRSYGYTELKPASNLLAPGSMVWVRHTAPFTAGVICTQKASLGGEFKPMTSSTTNTDMKKSSQKALNLDATYLEIIKGNAKFSDVSSITAHLDNAKILEVNDVDVAANIANRDEACSAAIKARSDGDYKVTMISSALQADVSYDVSWNLTSNLSANAKVAVLQDLAVELGLSASNVSETTISAKGLYWGIMDDAFLAHLSDPDAITSTDKGARTIPTDRTPHLELQPDVD